MRSPFLTTLLLPLALSMACNRGAKSNDDGAVEGCAGADCADDVSDGTDGTGDGTGDGGSESTGSDHEPSDVALAVAAHVKLIGEASYDYAGVAISAAGDVDGDGFDDVLVGAYRENTGGTDAGAAYVVFGPLSGEVPLAAVYQTADGVDGARFVGESTLDQAGSAVVGPGDVDGDGYDDVVVGAYGNDGAGSEAGATYLIRGPVEGDLDLANADAKLMGESVADLAGIGLAEVGDVNADGFADLLIGALMEGEDGEIPTAGTAYLVHGPFEGEVSLADADARIYAAGGDEGRSGWAVAGAGDVDGDGLPDLVSGDYLDASSGRQTGAAHLFLSPVVGEVWASEADGTLVGGATGDNVGISLAGAGDVNADGYADVVVGAQGDDTGGADAGAFYLVVGPDWGELTTADATAQIYSGEANTRFSRAVAGPGDVDGDGFDDVVVGSRYEDEGGTDAGAAWIFFGSLSGSHSAASIGTRLGGEAAGDRAGWSVAGAGDLDADGLPDVFVGAFGQDAGGYESGASYIIFGLGGP